MINTTNKRGALFDLDGVLIDTEGIYSNFWNAVDRRFPTGIDNFSKVIKGMNLQEILGNYFPDINRQNEVRKILEEFQRDMRYNYFTGAMEFVQELRKNGFSTCVVTSSDQHKMNELSKQHPEFVHSFDVIVTGDMVSHAKPHPECFLLAAHLAGCSIKDCFVFEDSMNGLKAGLASGAKVIGLTTTYEAVTVEPLCHLMINGLHELSVERLNHI